MLMNIPGIGEVDITNWDTFRDKVLFLLGEGIVQEIQSEAMRMGLYITGRYIRGFHHYIFNGKLNIDNDWYAAPYLEYGTYSYFDIYSFDSYPEVPIKKKDISKALRDLMLKGMMPFAPMRRVIYNQNKMDAIIEKWF